MHEDFVLSSAKHVGRYVVVSWGIFVGGIADKGTIDEDGISILHGTQAEQSLLSCKSIGKVEGMIEIVGAIDVSAWHHAVRSLRISLSLGIGVKSPTLEDIHRVPGSKVVIRLTPTVHHGVLQHVGALPLVANAHFGTTNGIHPVLLEILLLR